MGHPESQLANRTKGALERIGKLENDLASITQGVSQELNRQQGEISNLAEIVNACVGALGEDIVGKAVAEGRIAKLTVQAEQNKARVAEAVASKKLVAGTTVTPASIIVGREFAKDATEANPPGIIYINFNSVNADIQPHLLGKSVGDSIDTPVGGKFEVMELFEPASADVTPVEASNVALAPEAPAGDVAAAADAALMTDLGVEAPKAAQ